MYSVTLGFDSAKKRINNLINNEHYAEALLTSVFTFEKIIHRTLKQLIVSSGFKNKDAEILLNQVKGFKKQKDIWNCFDPNGKKLHEIIGNTHWQHVNKAVKMRNALVHGSRVYHLSKCKEMAEKIIELLDQTVTSFNKVYGYDGWTKVSIRKKSTLHSDPKVNL